MRSRDKQSYFLRRRNVQEHFFGKPWYRRLGHWIEDQNKRATFGLLRRILHIRNLSHPIPLSQVRSVLILRYDAIGDMVVSTPIWRTLKRLSPDIRIGVAGSFRNLEVIRTDPDVDVRYDFSERSNTHMLKAALSARKQDWDVVLALVYRAKTKSAVVSRLAAPKGKTSILVRGLVERYENLFNIVGYVPNVEPPVPMLDLLKTHFETVFDHTIGQGEWHPSLAIDSATEAVCTAEIERQLSLLSRTEYILLNTESATQFREWGLENCAAFSRRLSALRPDVAIAWCCSPNSDSQVRAMLSSADLSNVFFLPTPDLHQLFSLVRNARLVLSPDTSVIHIATAERKPTIGFYVHRNEWLPYGVPSVIFTPTNEAPVSSIPVESVLEATLELLSTSRQAVKASPSEGR